MSPTPTTRKAAMPSIPSVPSAPFRDLEEGRISPDEYAERTRREVREIVREAPPPKRLDSDGNKDSE